MGKSRDQRNAKAKAKRKGHTVAPSGAMRHKTFIEIEGEGVNLKIRSYRTVASSTIDSAEQVYRRLKAYGQQRKHELATRGHSIASSRTQVNRARRVKTFSYRQR